MCDSAATNVSCESHAGTLSDGGEEQARGDGAVQPRVGVQRILTMVEWCLAHTHFSLAPF